MSSVPAVSEGDSQRHGYGLGLPMLSLSNLLNLDGMKHEAMRVFLGTAKTSIQAMEICSLGRHWCQWPAAKTNAEMQMLVEANSKPHDFMIDTDGSVTRDPSGDPQWIMAKMQYTKTMTTFRVAIKQKQSHM